MKSTKKRLSDKATKVSTEARLDLVIQGALVYDGSGRAPYHADVGVQGDRIVAIGNLSGADAAQVINASGLALCPGFVDVHSHADMSIANPAGPKIFEPLVRQGITTFVGGNCGMAMAPVSVRYRREQLKIWDFFLGAPQDEVVKWSNFAQMLEHFEACGLALNCGVLAPHGMIRVAVKGGDKQIADTSEIAAMKRLLAECLEAGALGMSTGLQYFPGLCSDTRELIELARVVHDYNGVFTSHLRSYNSDTIRLAIDEVLTVGQEAEVPIQISHIFCVPHYGYLLDRLTHHLLNAGSWLYKRFRFDIPLDVLIRPHLAYLDERLAAGQAIGIDAMPTAAGFTHLLAFFPPWVFSEGVDVALRHISDPLSREKIRRSIEEGDPVWPHRGDDSWSMNFFKILGWDSVFIMSVISEKNKHIIGKTIAEAAAESKRDPFEFACDLILEEKGRVLVFETATRPGDDFVERSLLASLVHPNVSIVTDSILLGFGLPSHLFYDCYPKFIGQYARDRGLLSIAEAIRKCTSLPAEQLRIRDRGRIREGFYADMVVFDEKAFASCSTPTNPARFPSGIHNVIINGKIVLDNGRFLADRPAGRVIRRGC